MSIIDSINQIKSKLSAIEQKEKANQVEQANISKNIVELEKDLKQKQQLRNQLDQEALSLHTQAEELKPQLDKLERIFHLSQEFSELHAECQNNQDLLKTLYSSVSAKSTESDQKNELKPPLIELDGYNVIPEVQDASESPKSKEDKGASEDPETSNNYTNYSISIEEIRNKLPNAEKVYQQLVAKHLEEYKTYQNFIVDGLDLIWYAVAFVAFGRSAYRKMGFKYHPDLDGSERAMQLINTAWSISQGFVGNASKPVDSVNPL